MKIGIDARWILKEPSGIGQYTLNLIRYLSEYDKQNQYVLFFLEKEIFERMDRDFQLSRKKNFSSVIFPYSVFSLRGQLFLPIKLRKLGIDLFHSTNFMIPLLAFGTKLMVTVHDLIPFLFPEYAPRSKKSRFYWIYRILMFWIIKRVDHVLVDSENSHQDMIKHFSTAKGKTSVLSFGVDPSFKRSDPQRRAHRFREQFGVSGSILLYVGRQDPYKNLIGLVKIFNRLLQRRKGVSLVLAGPVDDRYPELKDLIGQWGLKGQVVMTGFLAQELLVELYHEASILVLPSFYEGFGLPILEAFDSGVPVVASRVASIPELVGDAGILLDPHEPQGWVDTIHRLLGDDSLRQELIQKGRERLKHFSWQRAIEKLLKHYEETCA